MNKRGLGDLLFVPPKEGPSPRQGPRRAPGLCNSPQVGGLPIVGLPDSTSIVLILASEKMKRGMRYANQFSSREK